MDLSLNLDFYEIVSHFISEYDYSAPAPLFDDSSDINLDNIFNDILNTSQNVVDIIFLPQCKNCLIFYPDDVCIRNNINLNFKLSEHVSAIDAKLKKATSNSTLSYFFLFYINALYLYFYLICSIFLILLYVHLVLNFSNILKDYINIIDVIYFNLLNFFFRVTFFLFFFN